MKSKIIIILIFCAIALTSYSCKKKKDSQPENEDISSPTSQPETPPSKIDGFFTSFYNYSFKSDTSRFQYGQVQASFYNQSQYMDSLQYFVSDADVGDLKVNGKLFQKSKLNMRVIYNYSPNNLEEADKLVKSRTWSISGNGSFAENQFTENTSIPEYLHNTTFPDTIYKYKNNEFKVGRLQNSDSAMIYIREVDGTGFSDYKTFGRSTKQINFTKENFYLLNPFYQFTFVEIEITFSKKSYQTIGGKTFQFVNQIYYKSYPVVFKAYE